MVCYHDVSSSFLSIWFSLFLLSPSQNTQSQEKSSNGRDPKALKIYIEPKLSSGLFPLRPFENPREAFPRQRPKRYRSSAPCCVDWVLTWEISRGSQLWIKQFCAPKTLRTVLRLKQRPLPCLQM